MKPRTAAHHNFWCEAALEGIRRPVLFRSFILHRCVSSVCGVPPTQPCCRSSISFSIRNIYTQLRTMFGVAEENDLIPRSPVRKKLHRPVHHRMEKPAWSADQVRSILQNVPENWFPFLACLAITTTRIGELLALSWKDIDWQTRKIRVAKSLDVGVVVPHTKTRTIHSKHVPEVLFEILRTIRRDQGLRGQRTLCFVKAMARPAIRITSERAFCIRRSAGQGLSEQRATAGSMLSVMPAVPSLMS